MASGGGAMILERMAERGIRTTLRALTGGGIAFMKLDADRYGPEGAFHGVLFIVDHTDNDGAYGWFENKLDNAPARLIRAEDILWVDFVAVKYSQAEITIKELIRERNRLKDKIKEHDAFIRENLLIDRG